ncbi:MAG: 50S ribosomal protein L25/general stress protein Ctc [Beijerinckiaceae bacterium]|jgi:large subunit ribosomal protein L25|nr:50S ribosomal protein L25/general stress protein Ctc [Beijerinckiaceae bacterium]
MATAVKELAATVRSGTGKGAARSERREGRVPAVIYGGGEAPVTISLEYKIANRLIYAGGFLTTIFDVNVDGQKIRAIPRDFQLDVVKDTPLHIDFLRLKAGAKLRLDIPVHFTGHEESAALRQGAALNVVRHTIEMNVPADNIPESIIADIKDLEIGASLHVSAVALPEGCVPVIKDRDFTIATMVPPRVEIVEAAPVAAAAGEKKEAEGKDD